MKKKILKNAINIIIIISTVLLNITCSFNFWNDVYSFLSIKNITIVSSIFTLLISSILIYKFNYLDKIIKKKKVFGAKLDYFVSLLLSCKSSLIILKYFSINKSFLKNKINDLIFRFELSYNFYWSVSKLAIHLFIIPILFVIWLAIIKYLIPYIINFIKKMTKKEWYYFIISNILFIVFALIVNINTNAFSVAVYGNNQKTILYDVVYTTDSTTQVTSNSFMNVGAPENDLRQPLFAVFSFPFGILAWIGSEMFNYLPFNLTYSFIIIVLQNLCLSICSILIARMINKKSNLYSMIGFNLMFTTLLFGINVEQYVFGLFWLIILIYNIVKNKKSYPLLFSAAVGSLITNVVLLPFIVDRKNIKTFIINFIKYCFIFGSILVIFGQTHTVLNNLLDFRYGSAIGSQSNVDFIDRLMQFIYFIPSCFIAPKGVVDLTKYSHASFQLPAITKFNILGIILIILMFISFIINRKKTIAKISFGWLIFSFIILCVIGWGTSENGLIIYGVYFSWAYFILIYLLLENILERNKKIESIAFLLIFILLIYFNFFADGGLIDIIKFGRQYYPFSL